MPGASWKYVSELDESTARELWSLEGESARSRRYRLKAQCIRLSSEGFSIDELTRVCCQSRLTISRWIDRWESEGWGFFEERARGGRPRKIPEERVESLLEWVEEEPRSKKRLRERLSREFSISVSETTVGRTLKKNAYRYKRLRRSLRALRNPGEFAEARGRLSVFERFEAEGRCQLFYFDESGFSLDPLVPYAWQKGKREITVPKDHKKRVNVAGLWSKTGRFLSFETLENIDSKFLVDAFDALVELLPLPSVIVLDNAPAHTAKAMIEKMGECEEKGLLFYFLPTYSPELNKIELLWKKIKYEWLPLKAWENWKTFQQELSLVLESIGSKYKLTYD